MERACLVNVPVHHTSTALYKLFIKHYYCVFAYDFKVNSNNYDRAAKSPGRMFIFSRFRAVPLIHRTNGYYYYYCHHYFLYANSMHRASVNGQFLNLQRPLLFRMQPNFYVTGGRRSYYETKIIIQTAKWFWKNVSKWKTVGVIIL